MLFLRPHTSTHCLGWVYRLLLTIAKLSTWWMLVVTTSIVTVSLSILLHIKWDTSHTNPAQKNPLLQEIPILGSWLTPIASTSSDPAHNENAPSHWLLLPIPPDSVQSNQSLTSSVGDTWSDNTTPYPVAATITHQSTTPLATRNRLSHRNDSEQRRDRYRHPAQTLQFFELSTGHIVLEMFPKDGWYSAILAPFLAEHGRLIAVQPELEQMDSFQINQYQQYHSRFIEHPENYGHIEELFYSVRQQYALGQPNSVDRVLSFRNLNTWMRQGKAQQVFNDIYQVLKPGGILGIVDHRASADFEMLEMLESGYVSQAFVTQLAINAGFLPAGSSEINANLRDQRRYPAGVWTLPPELGLDDYNRAKYEAIGESDRMTLKFLKPGN